MSKVILRKREDIKKYRKEESERYMRVRFKVTDVQILRNALSEIIVHRYPDSKVEKRLYYNLGDRRQRDVELLFTKICEKLDRING